MSVEKADKISSTVRLLKALLPDIDDALQHMEANGGWLPLKSGFVDLIEKLNISDWAQLYLDGKRLKAISLLSCIEPDELEAISEPEQYRDVKEECAELLEDTSSIIRSDEEIEQYVRELKLTTDEEKQEVSNQFGLFIYGFITGFFNYLALMVHGRTMCQLVADAVAGDDDAYRNAVHIDRSVLSLPYFQKRMLKAQFGRDEKFLQDLSYRLRAPILKSRIQYRTLWLTFAILEDEGLLDIPQEQLLDICQEVGVYGREQGVEDVGHLKKRLHDYKRYQGTSKII